MPPRRKPSSQDTQVDSDADMKPFIGDDSDIDKESTASPSPCPASAKKRQTPVKREKKVKAEDDEGGSPKKARTIKRWTEEEDALLMRLMEEAIHETVWEKVKVEGSLVYRTSYGVKYHASALGTGKPPTGSPRKA